MNTYSHKESTKFIYSRVITSLVYIFSITSTPLCPKEVNSSLETVFNQLIIFSTMSSLFFSVINFAQLCYCKNLTIGVSFPEQTNKGLPHAIIV